MSNATLDFNFNFEICLLDIIAHRNAIKVNF